jgi:superfamily II DNA or RNA helicase
MFDSFRRLIGAIQVIEKDNIIEINGVPAETMTRDISKIWGTSKINLHMFTKITRNSFHFSRFFAVDVLYMLETMLNDRKSYTNTRTLNQIIQQLKENTYLADIITEDENFSVKRPDLLDFTELRALKVRMKAHQQEFLEVYNKAVPKFRLNGYLLAADPGTGKTLNSLGLSLCLKADVTIIVSPNNAVHAVWEKTLLERFVEVPDYWIYSSGKEIRPTDKYLITHYEGLGETLKLLQKRNYVNPMIILDECHNLNEIESLRTQLFIKMCKDLNCKHVLWMSGTPIKALGSEMIPLLHCIDGFFDSDAEVRFKKVYGKNAARAVDILSNRLGLVSHKIIKDSGGKITETDVKVTVPDWRRYTLGAIRDEMAEFIRKQLQFYQANKSTYQKVFDDALDSHQATLTTKLEFDNFAKYKDYIRLIQKHYDISPVLEEVKFCNQYELKQIIPKLPDSLKNAFKDARSVVKYVQLKVQGEALGRIVGKRRAECAADVAKHADLSRLVDSGIKKTVIFTSYVEALKAAETKLRFEGYRTGVVFQDTNKDLSAILKGFERDLDINPLIATYKSLSTAVPLVMANVAIMVDAPFREYVYKQATARLDRMDQDEHVYVYNLYLDTGNEENISTRSKDILKWSKDQVASIMGIDVGTIVDVSLEDLREDLEGNDWIYNAELLSESSLLYCNFM